MAAVVGLLLFVIFVGVPFAEIYVLLQVGHAVGVLNTLALLILVSMVGAWLAKREGLVLAVQGRYKELNGRELALAITLSAFLSILPLLLVGIAIFGFFSAAASKDLAAEAVQRLGLDRSSDTARLITEAMHTAESSRK